MFSVAAGVRLVGDGAAVAFGNAGHLGAIAATVLEADASLMPVTQ